MLLAHLDYNIQDLMATTLANLGTDSSLDYVPNIGRKGVMVKTVRSNAFAIGGAPAALLAGKMKRWE